MELICRIIGHDWNGCICQRCGQKRDEGHDWNGCTCLKCGKNSGANHLFVSLPDKCETVCSICGEIGISQHEMHGCTCVKCGYSNNRNHIYINVPGKCETVCSICGKAGQRKQHDWVGDKCAKCGQLKEEYEFFLEMLVVLEAGYEEWYEDVIARSGIYTYDPIIKAVQEVRPKIYERYGEEGLDKMLELLRSESHITSKSEIEDYWNDLGVYSSPEAVLPVPPTSNKE